MLHPLARIPAEKRPALFIVLLISTLALTFSLFALGAPLRTSAAPAGIISYEFARGETTAQAILASWSGRDKIFAGFNLGLDYLYIPLYSTTIALAVIWVSTTLRVSGRILLGVAALAWGQWLAAALDAVENVALFVMLVDMPTTPWPQIAFWCAAIKFTLILLGIAYVLSGAVILFIKSRRQDAFGAAG
jgi:hypothetical protein